MGIITKIISSLACLFRKKETKSRSEKRLICKISAKEAEVFQEELQEKLAEKDGRFYDFDSARQEATVYERV